MLLILVWQMLLPMILDNLILFVADVIALLPLVWQLRFCLAGVIAMLLCYMMDGDVITIRLMLWPVVCIGRCYCQLFCGCWYCHYFDLSCVKRCTTVIVVICFSLLADVVAKMADGIAIVCVWQMLLPSG